MGALNLGSALYGGVRGMQDAEDRDMRRQSFETDQATRKFALQTAQDQAPLRQRALETGVKDAEAAAAEEGELRPLRRRALGAQVNIAELNDQELQDLSRTNREARDRKNRLAAALGSQDPQAFAEAFASAYPGIGMQNARGKLDEQGRLVVEADDENGQPRKPLIIAPGRIKETGEPVPVWDVAGDLALRQADPIAYAEKKWASERKIKENVATQQAHGEYAKDVARINAEGKEGRRDDVTINRNLTRGATLLSKLLKQDSPVGALIAGYNNAEDKELHGAMSERVAERIEDGELAERAVNRTRDEFKERYARTSKTADVLATELAKEKIDARDDAQLTKAAEAGNENAKRLKNVFAAAKTAFGFGATQHLQRTLKVTKKKD